MIGEVDFVTYCLSLSVGLRIRVQSFTRPPPLGVEQRREVENDICQIKLIALYPSIYLITVTTNNCFLLRMKYLIHIQSFTVSSCVLRRKANTLHVKCIIRNNHRFHSSSDLHRTISETHMPKQDSTLQCFSNPRPYVIEILIK